MRGKVIGRGDPLQRCQRLRAWRWSSYRGYSGLGKPEPWINEELVLGEMAGLQKGRRVRYRRFVEEGLLREIENPLEAVKWQTVLGTENFLQGLSDRLESSGSKHREVPALRRLRPQIEARTIFERVAQAYRCSVEELSAKVRGNEARAVAMVLVWDCCGLSLQEMVELFQASGYTAVSQMITRTREKDRQNMLQFKLAKLMTQCVK